MNVLFGLLAAILPGIIVYFLLRRFSGEMKGWKRVGLSILLPNLFSCLTIFLIIGSFNLFLASLRFQCLYTLCGLLLSELGIVFYYLLKDRLIIWLRSSETLSYYAGCGLFVITYLVYIPASVFLANIEEYKLRFLQVLPIILIGVAIAVAVFWLFDKLFPQNKVRNIIEILLFAVSLCIYIQSNFLNFSLPQLSGRAIEWSRYTKEYIIGGFVWCFCIAICIYLYRKAGRLRFGRGAIAVAGALCLMQLISLMVMARGSNQSYNVMAYSDEGLYEVGAEENVIVFIVDTLDTGHIHDYIESGNYRGELTDFDFFDNIVSGGVATQIGVPALLSGVEYDPHNGHTEYDTYINEHTVFEGFIENGWDARIYTEGTVDIPNCPNYVEMEANQIESFWKFSKALYQVAGYNAAPYMIKRFFYDATESLESGIRKNGYSIDNYLFYSSLKKEGRLTAESGKAFRVIHLWGVHPPFYTDENCQPIDESKISYFYKEEVLTGVLLEIGVYLEYLKQQGLYDKSTIIITGDHGYSNYSELGYRPAVLVKLSEQYQEISDQCTEKKVLTGVKSIVDTPSSFWNVANLLRLLDGDQYYGATIYEMSDDVILDRKQTVGRDVYEFENWNYTNGYARVRILDDKFEFTEEHKENLLYNIYDSNLINQCNYRLGDSVQWAEGNAYGARLGEGIWNKDDSTAILGYEFVVNLDLEDYRGKDVDLWIDYEKVYGDEQTVIAFSGKDEVFTGAVRNDDELRTIKMRISAENIEKNRLQLRLVFPLAVTERREDSESKMNRIVSLEVINMTVNEV